MQKSRKKDIDSTDGRRRLSGQDLRARSSAVLHELGNDASARIESMPLIALAGGLAVGAIAASLLPQTTREADLLEPVGTKIAGAGRASLDKVREAAKAKVDELAGDKLRDFFGFGESTSAGA